MSKVSPTLLFVLGGLLTWRKVFWGVNNKVKREDKFVGSGSFVFVFRGEMIMGVDKIVWRLGDVLWCLSAKHCTSVQMYQFFCSFGIKYFCFFKKCF